MNAMIGLWLDMKSEATILDGVFRRLNFEIKKKVMNLDGVLIHRELREEERRLEEAYRQHTRNQKGASCNTSAP